MGQLSRFITEDTSEIKMIRFVVFSEASLKLERPRMIVTALLRQSLTLISLCPWLLQPASSILEEPPGARPRLAGSYPWPQHGALWPARAVENDWQHHVKILPLTARLPVCLRGLSLIRGKEKDIPNAAITRLSKLSWCCKNKIRPINVGPEYYPLKPLLPLLSSHQPCTGLGRSRCKF